jgi:hypothetical protein
MFIPHGGVENRNILELLAAMFAKNGREIRKKSGVGRLVFGLQ